MGITTCLGKLSGVLNLFYIGTVTGYHLCLAAVGSLFEKEKSIRLSPDGLKRKKTIAIFHPYCNEGGGSERVLWAILRALQQSFPSDSHHFLIYTGDHEIPSGDMLSRAKNNFGININPNQVEFVRLKRRPWVEAGTYPVLTLLGQAIGSLYLGLEAFSKFIPDVYLDTLGYTFTLPLFRYLGGSRVGAYVHYPTITSEMLPCAGDRTAGLVSGTIKLSWAESIFYRAFAWVYCKAGRCSEVTMVNSSWTEGHILKMWNRPGSTYKTFPPCDVKQFQKLIRHDNDDEDQDKKNAPINLLSVGLFRAEKNHALQIRSIKVLKNGLEPDLWSRIRLVLLGSIRDDADKERVEGLKKLAKDLEVEGNVVFKTSFTFEVLKEELTNGLIGIHSMPEEHFGISVVECMAAGLLMVANKSGGPLTDIVITSPESERNGFLAETEKEYAQAIQSILNMNRNEQEEIRRRARSSMERFSDEEFSRRFKEILETIL